MPEPCKYLTKKIRQELIYILQRGARSSYISYKEETPGAHIYLTKKIRKELIYLTRKIYQELIYLLQGRCHELIYLFGNFFVFTLKVYCNFCGEYKQTSTYAALS